MNFDRDFEEVKEQLKEDLELLGSIEPRQHDLLLEFEDFRRIEKVIRKYTCEALWPSLRFLIYKRRSALQRNDLNEHRSFAFMIVEKEDMCSLMLRHYVLNHFGIEE